jgi:hypothetical protein
MPNENILFYLVYFVISEPICELDPISRGAIIFVPMNICHGDIERFQTALHPSFPGETDRANIICNSCHTEDKLRRTEEYSRS